MLLVVLQKLSRKECERKQPSHFVLGDDFKQRSDERDLPSHIPFFHTLDLSFPQHVHDLKPLQGPPRRLEGKEAHPWFRQTLDKAVILLDQ